MWDRCKDTGKRTSSCSTCVSDNSSYYSGSDSGSAASDQQSPTIKSYLRAKAECYSHSYVELADIAAHAWGMTHDEIETLVGRRWQLSEADLDEYLEACRNGNPFYFHEPFKNVVQHLLTDVAAFLVRSDSAKAELNNEFWVADGEWPLASGLTGREGQYRDPKPDLVFAFNSESTDKTHVPTWKLVKSVAEFRHSIKCSKYLDITFEKEDDDEETINDPGPPHPGSNRRANAFAGYYTSGQPYKRQKTMDYSELRLGDYAKKALCCTSRHYFVGMLVDNFDVTVVYYDHILTARTAKFDFRKETGYFALVLYGISQCSKDEAGWDPHHTSLLHWPVLQQGKDSEPKMLQEMPVRKLEGSCFSYDESPNGDYGSETFQVTEVFLQPREVIGRATSVYRVKRLLSDAKFSSDSYVLKTHWPLSTQPSEVDIIQRLQSRLPRALHKHLPQIRWQRSFTAKDLGLPSAKFKLPLDGVDYHERSSCTFATDYCFSLWEASSVDEFKQVWLDCLECHFHAYKEGHILHQDISEGNLMFSRGDNGVATGVLNDWDLACLVDSDGRCPPVTTGYHAGTPPFMAHELVWFYEDHGRRVYRHELESFLLLLIWVAILYDFDKQEVRLLPKGSILEYWMSPRGMHNCSMKELMLFFDPQTEKMYKEVQPAFRGLLEDWIKPLRELFKTARNGGWEEGWETYGGRLTFETFMAAIKVEPRVREN